MLKYIFLAILVVSVKVIDFNSIYDETTTAVSSAASVVADSATSAANYVAEGAQNMFNSTQKVLSSAADSIVDGTKSVLNTIQTQTSAMIDSSVAAISQTTESVVNSTGSFMTDASNTVQIKFAQLSSGTAQTVNLAVESVTNEVKQMATSIENFSTDMCQTQCISFFNLPCFLLFACKQKIITFFLIISILIILAIIMCCMCCGCCIGFILRLTQSKQAQAQSNARPTSQLMLNNQNSLNPETERELKRYKSNTNGKDQNETNQQ